MNNFSLGNAWSKGVAFFSAQGGNHALVLIGLGILVPNLIQYAAFGSAMGTLNPASFGQGSTFASGAIATGSAIGLAMFAAFIAQLGSYFASWRLGLRGDETVGGAVGWGLAAGAIVAVGALALLIVSVLIMTGVPLLGVVLLLALVVLFCAIFFTAITGLAAIVVLLVVLLGAAAGSLQSGGDVPDLLTGGLGLLILLLGAVLVLWLGARFACTAPIMAERRSFNLIAAAGESWRLTAAAQWRILAYLALLGVVLLVLFMVVAMILGGAMLGMGGGEIDSDGAGVGALIVGILLAIPFAFLTVLVPAGIYRELSPGDRSEVFA